MEKEIITLDGNENGFAIFNMATNDYVRNKKGIVLFRNIDLARIYATNLKSMTNPYDYDLYICIQGSMIQYDYFEKIDGVYQFYATCDDVETKYFVQPIETRIVNKIGYLVVNNGEREFDKTKGLAKTTLYFNAAINALDKIVKKAFIDPGLSSIGRDRYGLTASIKNSTAKIHICHNSQIMSTNQHRKAEGQMAFRFNKDMDKFTTLYVFIDIDRGEPKFFNGIDKATELLTSISNIMVESCEGIDSCEFKEIDLIKPMILNDNITKKNS
jgi:hypothetical protein